MHDIEERGWLVLYDVLCRIRMLAGRSLEDEQSAYIFQLADAAHNIPMALANEGSDWAFLVHAVTEAEEALRVIPK